MSAAFGLLPTYLVLGVVQIFSAEQNRWCERTIRQAVRAENPKQALEKIITQYEVIEQVQARWHSPERVQCLLILE